MQKIVLKLALHDDKDKKKAMKVVSGLAGVESISIDTKDNKLTVTGEADPVIIASRLRKLCQTEVVSVGPAKEPEPKKPEPKKNEVPTPINYWVPPPYNYPHYHHYYPSGIYVNCPDENEPSCVIC